MSRKPKEEKDDGAEVESARSVAVLLPQLEDGAFNADLSDAVRDLVAQMRDAERDSGGKPKGKVVIALELKLDNGAFDVRAEFKVSAPKKNRGRTIVFATDGNNLVRDNPRQPNLPGVRDVSPAKATVAV